MAEVVKITQEEAKTIEDEIRKCTESLEANRDDPIMLNKRAGYYLQLQQYEQALDDALYSVKLQENLAASWARLGFSQTGCKHYKAALCAFRKSLDLDGECKEAMQGAIEAHALLEKSIAQKYGK